MAWMISGDRKTEETIFMHQLKCNETSNENSSDAHFKPLYQQRERERKKTKLKKNTKCGQCHEDAGGSTAGQTLQLRHKNLTRRKDGGVNMPLMRHIFN